VKLHLAKGGMVDVPGINPGALPILRLHQYHCPNLLVDGQRLGDLDLKPSFKEDCPLNVDRAQLSKIGG